MEYTKRERLSAISIILCGLAVQFFVLPNFIDTTEEYELVSLSPSFFPSLTVWLITGLGGLYLIQTLSKHINKGDMADAETWLCRAEERKSLLSILLIIAYFVTLKLFGFIIATILVLSVMLPLQGVRGPVKIGLISILTTVGIHVLFLYLLQVHFPQGILFEWAVSS